MVALRRRSPVRFPLLVGFGLLLALVGRGKTFAWRDATQALSLQVSAIARGSPHKSKLVLDGAVDVDTRVHSKDNWEVKVAEDGHGDKTGVAVHNEGGKITFAGHYDSSESEVKPPAALGLHRVVVSASQGKAVEDFDWAFDVEGKNGRRVSVTADDGMVVYDASVGIDLPVNDKLSLQYAIDAKRRAHKDGPRFNVLEKQFNLAALKPDWSRQGGAVTVGGLKASVHQKNPDSAEKVLLDYHVDYTLERADLLGTVNTETTVSATMEDGNASYGASAKVKALGAIDGGFNIKYANGKPSVTTYGDISKTHLLMPGVALGVGTGLEVDPLMADLAQLLQMKPVNIDADIDLSELAPKIMDEASRLKLHTRFAIGDAKPTLDLSGSIQTRSDLPLHLAATGKLDDSGAMAGSVKVNGAALGVKARYEASGSRADGVKQIAEIQYIPDPVFESVVQAAADVSSAAGRSKAVTVPKGAGAFARVSKSASEHDGKPRVQMGITYDFGTGGIRQIGEDVTYDSEIDGELDGPWANLVRDKAAEIRKLVASSESSGDNKLRR